MAGGLNLYGFAGGDPVNFTDPFGLCPEWLDEIPCVDVIASPMRPANASTGSGVNGSWYGRTRFNQDGTPGKWHGGFDWAGAEGTAVVAPGDATVTYGEGEDSGLYAYMNLGNGATVSVSHLAADDETKERLLGTRHRVSAGSVVGYVGTSGNSAESGREPHGHVRTTYKGNACHPVEFFSKLGGNCGK